MTTAILIGIILLLAGGGVLIARKWGAKEKEADQVNEKLKGVQNAKAIKERVDHDPAFRRDVRDTFR